MSTIMFVVEFDSSVELIENISSLTEEELSSSIVNATYQFMQLLAVRPAGNVTHPLCTFHSLPTISEPFVFFPYCRFLSLSSKQWLPK